MIVLSLIEWWVVLGMCGQCYAYNRYATLPDSNSLSMGFSGYQNDNSSSQRDSYICDGRFMQKPTVMKVGDTFKLKTKLSKKSTGSVKYISEMV